MRHFGRVFLLAGVLFVLAVILYIIGANLLRGAHGSLPVRTISDGRGGAIVAWESSNGIYAQHVDAAGKTLWQPGGVVLEQTKIKNDPYAPPWSSFLIVSDGAGGAIISWDEYASHPPDFNHPFYMTPVPIYVQRVSAAGQLLWDKSAVAAGGNWKIISDANGGIVLAWDNFKPYFKALHDDYLCLLKIAPDGTHPWGDTGLTLVKSSPFRPISAEDTAKGIQGTISRDFPTYAGTHDIISDNDGGAIVIWEEEGLMAARQVYAQKIDSTGNAAWAEKIPVGNGSYQNNSLRAGNSGNFSAAFQTVNQGPVYQQQVSGKGELLALTQYYPYAVNDNSGGTIQMRIDTVPLFTPLSDNDNVLYALKLNKDGSAVWPSKPVFATQTGAQIGNFKYTADSNGGVVICWQLTKGHLPSGATYIQRLDADGNILFAATGINAFGTADNYQCSADIFGDGSGGVFVAAAVGKGASSGNTVCVQHLDGSGNRLWGSGIKLDK
jgi:hypothetical protein